MQSYDNVGYKTPSEHFQYDQKPLCGGSSSLCTGSLITMWSLEKNKGDCRGQLSQAQLLKNYFLIASIRRRFIELGKIEVSPRIAACPSSGSVSVTPLDPMSK